MNGLVRKHKLTQNVWKPPHRLLTDSSQRLQINDASTQLISRGRRGSGRWLKQTLSHQTYDVNEHVS